MSLSHCTDPVTKHDSCYLPAVGMSRFCWSRTHCLPTDWNCCLHYWNTTRSSSGWSSYHTSHPFSMLCSSENSLFHCYSTLQWARQVHLWRRQCSCVWNPLLKSFAQEVFLQAKGPRQTSQLDQESHALYNNSDHVTHFWMVFWLQSIAVLYIFSGNTSLTVLLYFFLPGILRGWIWCQCCSKYLL